MPRLLHGSRGFVAAVGAFALASRLARGRRRAKGDAWFREQQALVADRPKFDESLAAAGVAALEQAAAPARQQEAWRYTKLSSLLYDEPPGAEGHGVAELASVPGLLEGRMPRLVFVDGVLHEGLSRPADEAGLFVGGGTALKGAGRRRAVELLSLPMSDAGSGKLVALNQASFEDCACVFVEGDATVEVVFVTTGRANCAPRVIVDVAGHLHLVETHLSTPCQPEAIPDGKLSNAVGRVVLREGASMSHELLQQKADTSRFVGSLEAELAADASYKLRVLQSGARASRVSAHVSLEGDGASCDVTGVNVCGKGQQLDLHSVIRHAGSTSSRQRQKNLAVEDGECIFRGMVRVEPGAGGSESDQLCQSLCASRAKVKAMPMLQIQADDVMCSHGAAVFQLEGQELFYLQSRGLSAQEAKSLMALGFPQDLLTGLEAVAPKAAERLNMKLAAVAREL